MSTTELAGIHQRLDGHSKVLGDINRSLSKVVQATARIEATCNQRGRECRPMVLEHDEELRSLTVDVASLVGAAAENRARMRFVCRALVTSLLTLCGGLTLAAAVWLFGWTG